MRKIAFLLFACFPLLTFSCFNYGMDRCFAIKGEGPVVRRTLDLNSFTGVSLSMATSVTIAQGTQQSVEIEGQNNLIDLIDTDVKDGIWKIRTRKNICNPRSLKVYITIPKLTSTRVSGSGNIKGANLFDKSDQLDVNVSGSGDIYLQVATTALDVRISGSGDVSLSGNATTFAARTSGSGDIYAQNLITENATIRVSGSGNSRIHVTKQLDAKVSGSGDIQYKGQPHVVARSSGSGDIEAM